MIKLADLLIIWKNVGARQLTHYYVHLRKQVNKSKVTSRNFQHRNFCKGKTKTTMLGHIKEKLGLLQFDPSVSRLELARQLESFCAAIVYGSL